MRLRHPDGTVVHVAYCTNVHPAEDLAGVLDQLGRFAHPVRTRLEVPRLGLGLWLARPVVDALVTTPEALRRLRARLDVLGLEVVTLNGFPYQAFGQAEVKYRVYAPDWSTPERADYTAKLAQVLAELLPADAVRGSISTLPLGWRRPWTSRHAEAAWTHIDRLGRTLTRLAEQTGRAIRVGFEPEPGCVVENTDQAVTHLAGLDERIFGICLDTCHLAVAHENPATSLARLAAARLPVVKVQASTALEALLPGRPDTREALAGFVEPRFLHQTREACAEGPPHGADDLDEALGLAGGHPLPGSSPWRIHFHVPVHMDVAAPLGNTRSVLRATLAELFGGPTARTDHLEVETYTWPVLPADRRLLSTPIPEPSPLPKPPSLPEPPPMSIPPIPEPPPGDEAWLVAGIAAELGWIRDELVSLGLKAEP